MWKNHINTSGFRVIYKRPDTDYFSGWPMYLNHTFGEEEQTSEYEYIDLEKDIETLTICVDTLNRNERHRDFEGFEFT